jgi:hypothetical protein
VLLLTHHCDLDQAYVVEPDTVTVCAVGCAVILPLISNFRFSNGINPDEGCGYILRSCACRHR